MLAKRPPLFIVAESRSDIIPSFLCPSLTKRAALSPRHSNFLVRNLRVPQCRGNTYTAAFKPQRIHQFDDISPRAVGKFVEVPNLPQTCPGCGAVAQGLDRLDEAGYYNPNRRSVKAFLPRALYSSSMALRGVLRTLEATAIKESHAIASSVGLETIQNTAPLAQPLEYYGENVTSEELPMPICNRCHSLLHHNEGRSIIHPGLQSIQTIIDESPYSYNHIYHVLDAADFPLSLVPQLQRRLDLMPQRSQNRRSKTRSFSHGRRAELSFIITRSDLLAPQKEQVDSLMPYLQEVLRDALGASGKDVRLGNVRCVSAKRGWWTKQVKEEIWERGGGGWMVGKVNVGKSNLFECIFPKGRRDETLTKLEGSSIQHCRQDMGSLRSQATIGAVKVAVDRSVNAEDSLLPPAQPEMRFPIMPTVSNLPGTTASPIRIPFGNGKGELIDLPGLARGSLEDHVIESHRSHLVMRQRVKPEQFVIKPGQSLLIAGLIRITCTTPEVTILAYPFVPLSVHVTSTEKAIAIHTQTQTSGIPIIARPEAGQKMRLAGSFELRWDVTRQRAGPLTSSSAAALNTRVLPFVVYSTDVLIEGCGWVELAAQVRKKGMKSTGSGKECPAVDIWSPNGDYIAARRPMNGWLMGRPNPTSVGRTRPRRSMRGVKKSLKQKMRDSSS